MNLFEDQVETYDDYVNKWGKCEKCFFSNMYKEVGPCLPNFDSRKKLLVVGQWPGVEDMQKGYPFSGKQGIITQQMMEDAGFDLSHVSFTNVLLCNPPCAPTKTILTNCRDSLEEYIDLLDPWMIIALGAVAAKRFNIKGSINDIRGKIYAYREYPVVVCTHTASIDRAKSDEQRDRVRDEVIEDLYRARDYYSRIVERKASR